VAVLHLAALIYTAVAGQPLLRDSEEYLHQGRNLLEHGSWYCGDWDAPYNPQLESRRPPLYGLLLAGSMALGLGFWGVLVLQNLLSILNIGIVLRLLTGWGIRVPWWACAVALLLAPAQAIYANAVMTELLFQTLLLGLAVLALAYMRTARVPYVWWAAVAVALMALTKPVMYLFAGPLAVLLALYIWRTHKPWLHLAPVLLPVLVVAGVMLANRQTTGWTHYSSIQTFNLWNYNTYQVLRASLPPDQADSVSDAVWAAGVRHPNLAAGMAQVDSASKAVIRAHLGTYLGLHLRGTVHFLLDPGRFDLYQFLGWDQPGRGLLLQATAQGGYTGAAKALGTVPMPILLYLVLIGAVHGVLALAALLALASRRVPWPWVLFVLLCGAYLAVLTGPLGASRFRLPAEPLLWLLLPLGWEALRRQWRRWPKTSV